MHPEAVPTSTCSLNIQQTSHTGDITLDIEASPKTTAVRSTSQNMAQESTNAAEAWLRAEAKIPVFDGNALPPTRDRRHAIAWACFDCAIAEACHKLRATLLKNGDPATQEINYPKILLCQIVAVMGRRPKSYELASLPARLELIHKNTPGLFMVSQWDLDLAWREVAEYVYACAEQVIPGLETRNSLRSIGIASLETSLLNTSLGHGVSPTMQSPVDNEILLPGTPTEYAQSPEYVVQSSSPLQTRTPPYRQRSSSDHVDAAESLLVLRQVDSSSEASDAEQTTIVLQGSASPSRQRTLRRFASKTATAKSTNNECNLANKLHRDEEYGMNNPSGACQGCVNAWRIQEKDSDPMPPVPVDWCRIKRTRGFLDGLRCSGCVAKKGSTGYCNVANDIELQAVKRSNRLPRKVFRLLWTDLLEACDGDQAVASSYAPCFRTFETHTQIEEARANLKGVTAGTHTWDDVIRAENTVGNGDGALSTDSEESGTSAVTSPFEASDFAVAIVTTPNTEDLNEESLAPSTSPGISDILEGQRKRKSLPLAPDDDSAKRQRLEQD